MLIQINVKVQTQQLNKINRLRDVIFFWQNVPSQMFGRVLNTPRRFIATLLRMFRKISKKKTPAVARFSFINVVVGGPFWYMFRNQKRIPQRIIPGNLSKFQNSIRSPSRTPTDNYFYRYLSQQQKCSISQNMVDFFKKHNYKRRSVCYYLIAFRDVFRTL